MILLLGITIRMGNILSALVTISNGIMPLGVGLASLLSLEALQQIQCGRFSGSLKSQANARSSSGVLSTGSSLSDQFLSIAILEQVEYALFVTLAQRMCAICFFSAQRLETYGENWVFWMLSMKL
jgi:hypothetical protein